MPTPTPIRRRLRLLALALGAGLLQACASTGSSGAPHALGGVDWHLVELRGRPSLPAGDLGAPFLRFDTDSGFVSGNGGCNRMRGPYTRDGEALRFGALIATKRACADAERNRQETDFFSALEATRRHAVAGDTLRLVDEDAAVVARLVVRP